MQTPTIDRTQQKTKDDKFHQEPVVVLPDSGEPLNIAGSKTLHKIKSSATNSAFSVLGKPGIRAAGEGAIAIRCQRARMRGITTTLHPAYKQLKGVNQ